MPGLAPALIAAGLFAGCLPAGNPPAGQHVVHDRSLSGVFFTASEVEGTPSHILATGPLRAPRTRSALPWDDLLARLHEVPFTAGAAAKEGLQDREAIAGSFVLESGNVDRYRFETDSRGRPVFLTYAEELPSDGSPGWGSSSVERYDWVTGQVRRIGPGSSFLMSPGRSRIFAGTLAELDGFADIGSVDPEQGAFIGEDFYYVSMPADTNRGRTSLGRSRPGAEPELLLSSTTGLGLAAIEGSQPPQALVFQRADYGGRLDWYAPIALLDTATRAFTELPAAVRQLGFKSASTDGHWLLFSDHGQYTWLAWCRARISRSTKPSSPPSGTSPASPCAAPS